MTSKGGRGRLLRLPVTSITAIAVNLFLAAFLYTTCAATTLGAEKADLVRVVKSEKRLYLIKNNRVIESFRVTFGANPKGHKQQRGDERTPEGRYKLSYKNSNSSFYKSIHISYPNAQDRENARKKGIDPGGDIMVHGQAKEWEWLSPITQYFNWTDGCVALTNSDMDKVWNAVDPGTPIEIIP